MAYFSQNAEWVRPQADEAQNIAKVTAPFTTSFEYVENNWATHEDNYIENIFTKKDTEPIFSVNEIPHGQTYEELVPPLTSTSYSDQLINILDKDNNAVKFTFLFIYYSALCDYIDLTHDLKCCSKDIQECFKELASTSLSSSEPIDAKNISELMFLINDKLKKINTATSTSTSHLCTQPETGSIQVADSHTIQDQLIIDYIENLQKLKFILNAKKFDPIEVKYKNLNSAAVQSHDTWEKIQKDQLKKIFRNRYSPYNIYKESAWRIHPGPEATVTREAQKQMKTLIDNAAGELSTHSLGDFKVPPLDGILSMDPCGSDCKSNDTHLTWHYYVAGIFKLSIKTMADQTGCTEIKITAYPPSKKYEIIFNLQKGKDVTLDSVIAILNGTPLWTTDRAVNEQLPYRNDNNFNDALRLVTNNTDDVVRLNINNCWIRAMVSTLKTICDKRIISRCHKRTRVNEESPGTLLMQEPTSDDHMIPSALNTIDSYVSNGTKLAYLGQVGWDGGVLLDMVRRLAADDKSNVINIQLINKKINDKRILLRPPTTAAATGAADPAADPAADATDDIVITLKEDTMAEIEHAKKDGQGGEFINRYHTFLYPTPQITQNIDVWLDKPQKKEKK